MIDDWGIETAYHDGFGQRHRVPEHTLDALRRTIGPPDEDTGRPLVVRAGEARPVEDGGAEIVLEDGTRLQADGRLPSDLPLGYHRLLGSTAERRLIVSPGRCHLPPELRAWGWAAQLYAARSRESWGMGDLADLRRLSAWSRRIGAGMLLMSPVLAVAPTGGQQPSPYYPSSRRFLNPLYLRVEEVPGAELVGERVSEAAAAGRALGRDPTIDRDRVWALKIGILEEIWRAGPPLHGFDDWLRAAGGALETFAAWSVLAEEHGPEWRRWPADLARPDAPGVERLLEERAERIRFHQWLQWLVRGQLDRAGSEVLLIQDLPIGFDRGGADAWEWQDLLALDVSIGAPPDEFNAAGQEWGLPPFVPQRLAAAGYQPFIESVRAGLTAGGGLRIDHVMGLFRQFWIPGGASAAEGAFVRYPASDLLDVLALESHRANAVIVGEDLGTVEPEVREEMAARSILSYKVLWFEEEHPSAWPELSMASVTTHDLSTVAGTWTGADVEEQHRLGLAPDPDSAERIRADLADRIGLEPATSSEEVVLEVHRLLAEAPSRLLCAALEDVALCERRPNIPGADGGRPNWSIALPRTLEELEEGPVGRRLAEVFNQATSPEGLGPGGSDGAE